MTRDDIAAVGDVIARSGMRNQLRAVRVFSEIARAVEAGDDIATEDALDGLRGLVDAILDGGAGSVRGDTLKAAAAQETLPLPARGRAKGPMDEGE